MVSRVVVMVGSALAAGVFGFAVFELSRGGGDEASVLDERSSVRPRSEPRPTQRRDAAAATELAPRPGGPGPSVPAELPDYLERLRTSAEERGEVRVEDIEQGQRAIMALSGQLGPDQTRTEMLQFTQEMDRLKRDLPHRPTTQALDALAGKLETTDDPAERRELLTEYHRSLSTLPKGYQLAYRQKLLEMEGKGRAHP